MATQRYISTSFWDDEWIQTLDPSEKLLYLYLMTNPLTNIAGVYKITDRRIGFDTGFNLDTIRHIFSKFEKAGKAFRYNEYIVLPSWPKHQEYTKRNKIRDGIISQLQELPEDMIGFLVRTGYKFDLTLVFSTIISTKQHEGFSGTTVKHLKEHFHDKCQKCGTESGNMFVERIRLEEKDSIKSLDGMTLLCGDCLLVHKGYNDVNIPYLDVANYIDSDSDIDSDLDSYGVLPGAEGPAPDPQEPPQVPVIEIITNTKSLFPIYQESIDLFTETYPNVNILSELKKIKAWSFSNPKKRKTKTGMMRFINAWLSGEQDKTGKQNHYQDNKPRIADSALHPSASRGPLPTDGKPIVTDFTL